MNEFIIISQTSNSWEINHHPHRKTSASSPQLIARRRIEEPFEFGYQPERSGRVWGHELTEASGEIQGLIPWVGPIQILGIVLPSSSSQPVERAGPEAAAAGRPGPPAAERGGGQRPPGRQRAGEGGGCGCGGIGHGGRGGGDEMRTGSRKNGWIFWGGDACAPFLWSRLSLVLFCTGGCWSGPLVGSLEEWGRLAVPWSVFVLGHMRRCCICTLVRSLVWREMNGAQELEPALPVWGNVFSLTVCKVVCGDNKDGFSGLASLFF